MRTLGQRLASVAAALSLLSVVLLSAVGTTPVAAGTQSWSHRDARVCDQAGAGQAQCTAIARAFYQNGVEYHARTQWDLAAAAAAAQATSYNGTSIRTAYGITAQGDPSRVIAIVDAYDDPNAFANLTTFRSGSGLPAIQSCLLGTLTNLTSSSGSPCFTKVNQTGGTSLPAANSGWSNEIDLDLQAASSVCPKCSILLLEAGTASVADLGTAVTTASTVTSASTNAHVLSISNSYGISGDYPGSSAPAYDNAAAKGLAMTASAGDGGYGVLFPASATNVIGVGGTTLTVGANGARTSEIAWSGTGSGCSVYNPAPVWQTIPSSPCGTKKAVADLSADADPNSGLAIYTTYSHITGYWVFGGTSLSSPIIAALYAMQGGYSSSFLASQYAWAAGTPHYDVTSGSNGTCSPTVLCTAGSGWDGPTGLGSIATAPSAPPVLTTITITPATASVPTLGMQQFTATGYDQNGVALSSQPAFTWTATGGTITAGGLYTAGSTAGGYLVTASSTGVSGTATVTVTAPPVLTRIGVSPTTASVQVGGTQQFAATGYDQNGAALNPQPTFTWSVSGGGSINAAGLFTAGATPGGPFVVTASALGATGPVTGTASVTVVQPGFSLSASPTSRSIRHGLSATYTITITRTGSFAGSVALTATGLGSGATASFSPSSTTGPSSRLTVTTSRSATRGTFTLTITGTSGSQATVTVTLQIN